MSAPRNGSFPLVLTAAGGSVVIFLTFHILPFAGHLAHVLAATPLMFAYRWEGPAAGRLAALIGWVAAMLIMFAVYGGYGGVFFLFYAALAVGVGETLGRGGKQETALAVGAVAGTLILAAILGANLVFAGLTLHELVQVRLENQLNTLVEANRQMGADPEKLAALRAALRTAARGLVKLGPGVMFSGALLAAWGNFMIVRMIPRAGVAEPPSLNRWRLPDPVVWLVIACGVSMLFTQGVAFWVGANLVVALSALYFFQGLAVLSYWMRKKGLPRLARGLIYVLVLVQFFAAALVALAGLFDTWFDFRKLGTNQAAGNGEV